MHVRFVQGGDDKRFTVALASMLSKYLREVFMKPLNRFFEEKIPGLKPTAGYAVDGQRFLAEVEPEVRALGIDRRLLVRNR
jgi:ribonuclease HII